MSSELTPKTTLKRAKQSKRSREAKKYQKKKYRKQVERERERKHERERYIAENTVSSKEQWEWQVNLAKIILIEFTKRTGRVVDIKDRATRLTRKGQDVLGTLDELFSVGRGWINLQTRYHHHPILNRSKLRDACVKLQIPYWREMTVDEMRATLLLVAWLQKVDPELDHYPPEYQ
jgi:hypothetical protein